MAEYIEREVAIEAAKHVWAKDLEPSQYMEGIPLADVAPVRHGRWLLEREPDGTPYCFHCSACDDDFRYIGITVAYDYCPNCGAKMDLEEQKDESNS